MMTEMMIEMMMTVFQKLEKSPQRYVCNMNRFQGGQHRSKMCNAEVGCGSRNIAYSLHFNSKETRIRMFLALETMVQLV